MVLVLAIAGLIFLMVFIALPALQRSQRDTQRRNDYSMLSSAITSFSTSNQGKLYRLAGANKATEETCLQLSASKYINADGADPNGQGYQVWACTWKGWLANKSGKLSGKPTAASSTKNEDGTTTVTSVASAPQPESRYVFVVLNANCNGYYAEKGYSVPAYTSSSRAFAIYGYTEGGSGTYCSASQ